LYIPQKVLSHQPKKLRITIFAIKFGRVAKVSRMVKNSPTPQLHHCEDEKFLKSGDDSQTKLPIAAGKAAQNVPKHNQKLLR
jgi:hypothetical protein